MANQKMTSIMMRGSLGNSASKDRMSASASMLPPINHRSVLNRSKDVFEEAEYEDSPRQTGKSKAKKPPIS